MAFPRRLLSEGEEIVLDLRPHWIALVVPVVQVLLMVGAIVVLLRILPDSSPRWARWAIVVAGIVAILAVPARRIVAWATSHFVVTTERLIHRTGWFAKSSMEIPLENISDVRFHQGVFERVIGAGDLTIESPGTFGQETFDDIRRPEHVQKVIYEMNEANRQRMLAPQAAPGPPVPPPPEVLRAASVADELAKLEQLRARGVLSPEEFAAQKSRLLGSS